MDISAVNSNLNLQSLFDKDRPISDDLFSELFSAVFSNFFINQNPQETIYKDVICIGSNINIENINNVSLNLNLKDLNTVSAAADFIKNSLISSNEFENKENVDKLDLILKELGLNTDDLNNKIPLIINEIKQNNVNQKNVITENIQTGLVSEQDKNIEVLDTNQMIEEEKGQQAADKTMNVHLNKEKLETEEIKETKETDSVLLKAESKKEGKTTVNKPSNEVKDDKTSIQAESHINKIKEFLSEKVEDKNIPYIKNNEDLIDVVVEKFKTLRVPGYTQVKVKLMPQNLGEITVKVVLEKGQINGNIIADKKDTANIIMGNIETLKSELKNSNVNLNNISVNIASDENYNEQRNHSSFNNFNGSKKNQDNLVEYNGENNKEKEDGFSIIA